MTETATATRARRREQTRNAIVDAAIEVFAALGYDGGNFREITARCGAKRPLILYHFGSKEQLWKEAVAVVASRFDRCMRECLTLPADAGDEQRLRTSMSAFLDALIEVPEYGRILLREGTAAGPRLEWLARCVAPPAALGIRFDDPGLERRVKRTIVRDILTGTFVSLVALGPLLDASLAAALHREHAGIHPLSAERKAELIELMVKLVLP